MLVNILIMIINVYVRFRSKSIMHVLYTKWSEMTSPHSSNFPHTDCNQRGENQNYTIRKSYF